MVGSKIKSKILKISGKHCPIFHPFTLSLQILTEAITLNNSLAVHCMLLNDIFICIAVSASC
jgi:hypothetical protein